MTGYAAGASLELYAKEDSRETQLDSNLAFDQPFPTSISEKSRQGRHNQAAAEVVGLALKKKSPGRGDTKI
jgi:hypothetical protein